MKHIYTLFLLISISFGFAQDFKEDWKKVIQFELDGKIKSAHEVVENIYTKAKTKKIEDQIIKCFFYQSKFIQVSDEDYQTTVINNLTKEIKEAKKTEKAILNFVYVSILQKYYRNYQYNINQRSKVNQISPKDFKVWTSSDFQNEIKRVYDELLIDEKALRSCNIKEFNTVFEISPYTDTKKLSVYDFLYNEMLNYLFSELYAYDTKALTKTSLEVFKNTTEFIKLKTDTISHQTLKKIIETYQHNENYYLKNNSDEVNTLHFNRMKRFRNYFVNPDYYFTKISELEQKTNNAYLLQDLNVEKVKHYISLTEKDGNKNYYPEALAIIEKILNNHENLNAKSEAETFKEKILRKKISLNIPDRLFQNQNYRAFVEFKNVDTVKISYYKIPLSVYKNLNAVQYQPYYSQNNQTDRDSLETTNP
jgi:hypothetical protein